MDNTITVQWMNLTIENSYLIFLFSIIVFFAHQNCASLMIDNFQLGNRVKSIYKTCIKDSNIFTIEDSDYLTNDILSSFISEKLFSSHRIGKFYYSLNLFFSMAVIFFLPLVAEVLAFINLTQTFGYAWWLLLIFIFIVLFEVIIVISLLKQLFS